jgi:acyl-CoA-binding protein
MAAPIEIEIALVSGDNTAAQPWAIQIETRQKWDAWESVHFERMPVMIRSFPNPSLRNRQVKGTSKEDAAKGYVAELESQKVEYGQK